MQLAVSKSDFSGCLICNRNKCGRFSGIRLGQILCSEWNVARFRKYPLDAGSRWRVRGRRYRSADLTPQDSQRAIPINPADNYYNSGDFFSSDVISGSPNSPLEFYKSSFGAILGNLGRAPTPTLPPARCSARAPCRRRRRTCVRRCAQPRRCGYIAESGRVSWRVVRAGGFAATIGRPTLAALLRAPRPSDESRRDGDGQVGDAVERARRDAIHLLAGHEDDVGRDEVERYVVERGAAQGFHPRMKEAVKVIEDYRFQALTASPAISALS